MKGKPGIFTGDRAESKAVFETRVPFETLRRRTP